MNLTHACLELDHSYDEKGQRFANHLPPDRFAKEIFHLACPCRELRGNLARRFPAKSNKRTFLQRGNENVDVDNDNIEGDNVEVLNDDIKG